MTDSSTVGPGTVLAGRYELTDIIGQGGFGTVWAARQINMDRDVAIKILPEQFMSVTDVVERFKREARLASRLRHPNTITLHDYGKHENLLYIVMERLHGEDLADVLQREGKIKPKRVIHIARQVLKSLAEAHDEHIIHRDLKPENIFLSVVGDERDHVKVLDFGIAKLTQPSAEDAEDDAGRKLTMSGSTVGTPTYMSPEQAAGEDVDGQTDLYALGIIMYESVCGRPPFHHKDPVKVMRAQLFEPVPPFRDKRLQGSLLDRVIRKALQKERERRFETAHDMLRALAGEPAARPKIEGIAVEGLGEPSTQDVELDDPTGPTTEDFAADESARRFPNTLSFAESIDPSGETEAKRQGAEEDVVPFDAVEGEEVQHPDRETVRSGVTSDSSLTNSPDSIASPPSEDAGSSSSILTVIEPADESDDDDVILLTKKKTPSASSSVSNEVAVESAEVPAAQSDDSLQAERPRSQTRPGRPPSVPRAASHADRSGEQYQSWQFGGPVDIGDPMPEADPAPGDRKQWIAALVFLLFGGALVAGIAFYDQLMALISN